MAASGHTHVLFVHSGRIPANNTLFSTDVFEDDHPLNVQEDWYTESTVLSTFVFVCHM